MAISLAEVAVRLRRVKWTSDRSLTACCPSHEDSEPSLSVKLADDGTILLYCFAGCGFAAIVRSLGFAETDFFPDKEKPMRPAANTRVRKEEGILTLAKLAAAKHFDIEWLREHGVEDFPSGKGPGVCIGYFLEDETQHVRLRQRTALKAKDGSYWVGPQGVPPVPYGLWLLPAARSRGFLIIAEGETDPWALWWHKWPALGLPGARNVNCLQSEHVRGFEKIYVIQEPDTAGTDFPARVAARLRSFGFQDELLALKMPGGAKDPCELHIAGTFEQEFQWAFENATLIGTAPQARRRVDCNIAGSDLEERTQATFTAISEINARAGERPELFANTRELALIEDGKATPPTLARMRQWLTRNLNFQAYDRRGNLAPLTPPDVLVQNVMVYQPSPLPHLTRVVRRPVFANDGRLIMKPGYDASSGLVYLPSARLKTVAPGSDVAGALALIADLICDFNFETPADRANWYACLLQPIFRELIDGPTPVYRFEAPTAGTGKGLLFGLCGAIHGGYVFTTPHNTEEEWAKSLLTHLRSNPEMLLIDNCSKLDSDQLAAATTAWPTWTARLLSTLDAFTVSVRCLWAVTINNPQLREDALRRMPRIRICPKPGIEEPWLDTNFKHRPLMDYVQANLVKLVEAVLTVAVYAKAKMEPFIERSLGSYDAWARVMGGVLKVLEIPSFLEKTNDALARNRDDVAWREFVSLWYKNHKNNWMRIKDLLVTAQDSEINLGQGGDRSQQTVLGSRLARFRGKVIGNFLLEADIDEHRLQYRVTPCAKEQK